jgi:hypothetical protein
MHFNFFNAFTPRRKRIQDESPTCATALSFGPQVPVIPSHAVETKPHARGGKP